MCIRDSLDTHQDIIGHDTPVRSRILPDHNKHGAFEGHKKEDVTSKVSDPPFTNFIQRSESNKKTHAHCMTFWWRSFPLSEELRPCEDLRTSWSGEVRMLPCIQPQETPLFSKGEKVVLLFLVTVKKTNFVYVQCFKE